MKIYFIRHGSATTISESYTEINRPLTEEGQQEAKKLGKYLSKIGVSFDKVWTSPYMRAIQTGQNICSFLNKCDAQTMEFLRPKDCPKKVINEIISSFPNYETLAVVGHQPQIGKILCNMIHAKHDTFEILPATLTEVTIIPNDKEDHYQFIITGILQPKFIL